jgi:sulfide:quinone oxidoreductase
MTAPLFEVVVAGGGIAGLEALLALRELAGDRVSLTVVEPRSELALHALEPAEPFGAGTAGRLPVAEVADLARAHVVRSAIERVDADGRTVTTCDGEHIGYDALMVAVGARPVVAAHDAMTWWPGGDHDAFAEILAAAERGSVRSIAFVVPPRSAWQLPAYELALMTGHRLGRRGRQARLRLITPEPAPLAVFGPVGSAAVARELEDAGVELFGNAVATVRREGRLVVELWPSTRRYPVDRVVALPRAYGPELPGLRADIEGFLVTDERGRVHDTPNVWAVGDATDRRPMTGGLAALQADCAAREIAALAGADVQHAPYTPVLRSQLRTGRGSLWLQRDISDPLDHGTVARTPLWSPPGKIAARRLGVLLAERDRPAGLPVAHPA